MNPEDQNYAAGAEAAQQADSIQKQMAAEAAADAPQVEQPDNSIMASIEADEDVKSLSDVIHEGATQPDPTPTDFTSEPVQPAKKPGSKKPLIIAIIAILIIAGAGVGVWLLMSGKGGANPNDPGNGGAKSNPEDIAFFVADDKDDSLYAVYNGKGEKVADAVFNKVSDFNKFGYAAVKKADTDQYGIVANSGKLSVGYERYDMIEGFSQFFLATKDGTTILIDGEGNKITDVEQSEARNGLYAVFDGTVSTIYDKYGNTVGETGTRKPITESTISKDTICFLNGTTLNCFDTNSGEKVTEFQTDKKLELSSPVASASADRQCMIFKDKNDQDKLYLYYWGDLKPVNNRDFGMIVDGSYEESCHYTDGSTYIAGKDGIKVNAKMIADSPSVFAIVDSEHYAYSIRSNDGIYTLYVHINGKEKSFAAGKTAPEISAEKDLIAISYTISLGNDKVENYFAVFKDSFTPYYELQHNKYPTIAASLFHDFDENNNITTGRTIINKDKGVIYQHEDFTGSISYVDGVYLVRQTKLKKDDYLTAVVGKDGKAIIPFERYDTIKKVGKYFVVKKGTTSSVLNLEGKVVLTGFERIEVYDTHFEAMKDGTTEYYTLDAKKVEK